MSQTYQQKAYATAIYGCNVEYPFCSLAEEAGEVLGHLNKYVRKNNVNMNDAVLAIVNPSLHNEFELRDKVVKELGDLQWQLAACCTEIGITLEELQKMNLAKLQGRVSRGTLNGAGDNR
jgi:NTP pyrophosphatase (non-canonical NTP hydrolase)